MTTATWIALGGLFLAVLVHTAVLFRWGGRVTVILETLVDHRAEMRQWKHDQVTPRLFKVDELWRKSQSREGDEV